jgi:hypothetical protein
VFSNRYIYKCEILILYTWPWSIIGGECHATFTLKTPFVDFEMCSRNVANKCFFVRTYTSSGSQRSSSLISVQFLYIVEFVLVLFSRSQFVSFRFKNSDYPLASSNFSPPQYACNICQRTLINKQSTYLHVTCQPQGISYIYNMNTSIFYRSLEDNYRPAHNYILPSSAF